jgi:hypothetical protein
MIVELTKKQREFAEAALSGKYRYLLFGGGIRSGKSYVGIEIILLLCKVFPGSRWAIVRKDLPTLRRNTIPTFDKIAHPFAGPVRRDEWLSHCENGSTILFFPESFDIDPELNRWRGLEVNGFLLEEMNELQTPSFNKAIERAGSWVLPGPVEQPFPIVLGTCNPSQGLVKTMFHDPWHAGTLKAPFYFLPATILDNPHLPPEYIKSLENLKKTDINTYLRFVRGDWTVTDDPTQLIKFEWINAAKNVEPIAGKKWLGVDVARYGDDDSCLCEGEGNRVTGLEYHHGLSTTRVAEFVEAKIVNGPIDAGHVFVDVVGLGAGVVDTLESGGYHVVSIVSGAVPEEDTSSFYTFKNLRSQMWWRCREQLREGKLCIDVDDSRLVEDLTAPRYRVSSDKVLEVESKDDIKKRIGRSTDAGDAFVYGTNRPQEGGAYVSARGAVSLHTPIGQLVRQLHDSDDDEMPRPPKLGGIFGGDRHSRGRM